MSASCGFIFSSYLFKVTESQPTVVFPVQVYQILQGADQIHQAPDLLIFTVLLKNQTQPSLVFLEAKLDFCSWFAICIA